jgi:dolichyl-phosphate-mannose-protein mannosyltransferase
MTRTSKPALLLLLTLPLVKLVVHLAVGSGYGYHGDELYYLVCADHLDWGYVDHPPFSIFVLALTRLIAGSSVQAIRVVPALAGALTVLFVGLMVRELEGGPFAMALAMVSAITAPAYLSLDQYFSMNALDILFWSVSAWIMLRILRGGSDRLWILLGVVMGVGLLNKISVLWLGGGLAVGLLLTPQRTLLATRGPWLAAALALVLGSPYAVWQTTHGFATVRVRISTTENKLHAGPLSFLDGQVEGMLRVAAPVWIAGLVFYLFLPAGRGRRVLGWAWVAVLLLLAFSRASRVYYGAASFSWLLAGGGVAIESWLKKWWGRLAIVGYTAAIVLYGIRAAPVVLPILPQQTIAAFSLRTGGGRRTDDVSALGALPEALGKMAGFDEIVDGFARAYAQLPAADRANSTILVPKYVIAAAIDVLGRSRGLPPASSGHNNYWLWGYHGSWDGPIVVIGHPEHRLRDWFREIRPVAQVGCQYCGEPRETMYVVRGLRLSPEALWAQLKRYE